MTFTPKPEQYIAAINLSPAPAVLMTSDGTVYYDLNTLIQHHARLQAARIDHLDAQPQEDPEVKKAYLYELGISEFLLLLEQALGDFREGFWEHMPTA